MATDVFNNQFEKAMFYYLNNLSLNGEPSWAQDDWALASETGVFDGARPEYKVFPSRPLSRQELVYILDKLHLL